MNQSSFHPFHLKVTAFHVLASLKNLCRRFYVFGGFRRVSFFALFHDSNNRYNVSGVFYLKNIFLARPRFEPATARNTFQHKNTKPQPSVLGYFTSCKLNNQLPISIIFWIWSISKDVGRMFWLT
jgi:hypothetical protein